MVCIRVEKKIEQFLDRTLPVLMELTAHSIPEIPSLRKTIDRFESNLIYDKVIDFFIDSADMISCLEEQIDNAQDNSIDISYRMKTEQSFIAKWKKILGNQNS